MKKLGIALLCSFLFGASSDTFVSMPQSTTSLKTNSNAKNFQKKISNVQSDTLTKSATPLAQKISIKDATLKAINTIRARNQFCAKATTPLKWSQTLYEAAKEHSIDMAVNNFVGHDGSGKKEDLTAQKLQLNRPSHFYERVNQAKDSKRILSGELVIAISNDTIKTPKALFNYWMRKSEDCKALMDPRFKSVALAKVVNKNTNKAYWTLLLAGEELK